jgi:hypothetical protein
MEAWVTQTLLYVIEAYASRRVIDAADRPHRDRPWGSTGAITATSGR